MMAQGFPQQNSNAFKGAGDGVTSARWLFGNLCRGDKDTSKKEGVIGDVLQKQLENLDANK